MLETRKVTGANLNIRLKALFWDWLFISAYLIVLMMVSLLLYYSILGSIPELTEVQSQWIAFLTSVLPIICIFSIWESNPHFASMGKRKAGLVVKYRQNPIRGSIIRNVLKFLPWQFGHMSAIRGIYYGYQSELTFVLLVLSVLLPLVYVVMALFRTDHKHLADVLAGSVVDKRSEA